MDEKQTANDMTHHTSDDEIRRVLDKYGYGEKTKLGTTLQGSIWRVSKEPKEEKSKAPKASAKTSIMKITDKVLHNESITIQNNKQIKVYENIVNEQNIIKYLSEQKDASPHVVKYKQSFETDSAYYLEMEDGGVSLFDFVKQANAQISCGRLDISEWQKVANIIFKQMIDCIQYIHSKNVCHFDVSLENWLINDVEVEVQKHVNGTQKLRFIADTITIKLCDFGCAHLFSSSNFESNRYCGKHYAKSPEIMIRKKYFNAKANDVWSIGICLYLMSTFCLPWNCAKETDEAYLYAMKHGIIALMQGRGVLNYVDPNLIFIFQSIFKLEEERISINEIQKYGQKFLWNTLKK